MTQQPRSHRDAHDTYLILMRKLWWPGQPIIHVISVGHFNSTGSSWALGVTGTGDGIARGDHGIPPSSSI